MKMFRLSLRTKIAISFAAVILTVGLVTTVVGVYLLSGTSLKEAQNRVRLDSGSASEIYNERLRYISSVLEFTSFRATIIDSLVKKDRKELLKLLKEVKDRSGIELLNIADSTGTVLVRTQNSSLHGDSQASNPIINYVLKNKKAVASTEIISGSDLIKEGKNLADRARMTLIATPKAKPTDTLEVDDGMMMLAGYPLISGDRFIGVIYGGDLLNKSYGLVDKIKDIVYKNQKYKGLDIGTVTIFQNDVRIATNVLNSDGTRAIGTRVSSAVNDRVLVEGSDWIDEAFVVNDWYITAYEPIKNLAGKVIGILYVGILKRPFEDAKWRLMTIFVSISVLGVLIVILVSNFVAGRIARPLRKMRDVAKRIAEGDYSKDIDVRSSDVVGELAEAFNKMTKKLLGVQEELQDWVKTLEDKVEARTKEIKEMQKELIQIEKMASVGRLAAGVAHEINNPLTGILTNASLLMEEFPQDSSKYEDLKTIVDETIRCRKIVKDLLDFSRQTQPEQKLMDINPIIDATCELVWNQVSFKNIYIKKDLAKDLPKLMLDRDQITQVFMNILLNASDAMPRGGDINVTSRRNEDGKFIEIIFKDTGMGIDPGDIKHLFDPFFTTKAHGTGLGLAISYGIVQQHGGTIKVESEKGKGATFIVRIPLPKEEPKEEVNQA